MKSKLALPLALALAGCAHQGPTTTAVPVAEPLVADTVMDPTNQANVRNPSVVQTLAVGPSIDPHDPNVRVDAHNVERVVQSDNWNLHPNVPTAINMGPVVAVDTNQQPAPLQPELEQKIQEENQLLKVTTEQNDAMAKQIAVLQETLKAKSNTDQENSDLKQRVAELEQQQQQIAAKLQQKQAAPPVTPATKTWWPF